MAFAEVPITHIFKSDFLKTNPPQRPANRQPYIKITMHFNKRPDISEEYFLARWHGVHADIITAAKSWKEGGILRYNQFYMSSETRALAASLKYDLLEFSACSEFWVRDFNDWVQFAESEEYSAAEPDAAAFLSMPVKIVVGYDNLIYGTANEKDGGNDGILRDSENKL